MVKKVQLKQDRNIRLLMVEDNPADARLVQEMLADSANSRKIELTRTGRLKEALELLHNSSFDVLLIDLGLPDSQGLDTLYQIQTAKPSLPVVVLSGHDDEQLALEAVQAGAQDYLVKGQGDGNLLTRALYYAIERKRSEERLAYLAQYDPLTDLPNRALFRERLTRALKLAMRRREPAALIFLDLDHFMDINDTLGHDAGDELLLNVAARLKNCIRAEDTIARLGGDEFTIILGRIIHKEEAATVAEKIIDVMSRPFSLNNNEVFVTASLGIATYPACGGNPETLIKNADTALYSAKAQGRSNYQFYEAEMNVAVSERMVMINDLRHAVQRGEFLLYYQPKLCAKRNEVIGMEALLRWNHPVSGIVLPTQFIPLLEETGLIIAVGKWVLRVACEQNQAWISAGLPPLPISVNISARQFHQKHLVSTVADILNATGLDPRYLELEITESVLLENADNACETLRELHDLGVQLAIDDFGTGYSSLNYLKQFTIHTLKLDRTFIEDIGTNANDAAIVEAVIGLGHSLRLKVVAEGVETEKQLNYLRDRGCDEVQGFYFSCPVPPAEYERWYLNQAQLPRNLFAQQLLRN
ncbi:MAG: EAL domain-containing protein [Gammaproteobacteria bacterium]|nr:EAL domain-containing protein [Gammaproteobacteria bacterium]